jgi:hypothetical protein
MSANVEKVEHAVTETLNAMQLHEHCGVQNVLNELRQADPNHFRDNVKLYEKMTSNYAGFPHLEISNIANSPDNPITCPASERDCHAAKPHVAPPREVQPPPPPPPPAERPQYVAPPREQPQYVAPPQPPQAEYAPPPPVPPPMQMVQPQLMQQAPEQSVVGNVLGGLAEGLGLALGAAVGGRFLPHGGDRRGLHHEFIPPFPLVNLNGYPPNGYPPNGYPPNGYPSNGYDPNSYDGSNYNPAPIIQPLPIYEPTPRWHGYPRQQNSKW